MKKVISEALTPVVFLLVGLLLGMGISRVQHKQQLINLEQQAAQITLQLHLLEEDLDEVVVFKYFIEETYEDLRKLAEAIDNLIPRRAE